MADLAWPPRFRYGDRICIVGPQGSGKTSVECSLLKMKRNVIAIDTKQDGSCDSIGIAITNMTRRTAGRFVWKAHDDFVTEPGEQSKVYRALLKSGPRVVGIDEGYDVLPSRGLRLLATQGRGKKVSVIVTMQRPTQVPLFLISEANYYIIFNLRIEDDRKRMEKILGAEIPWRELREHAYSFLIVDSRGRQAGPYRLDLTKTKQPLR